MKYCTADSQVLGDPYNYAFVSEQHFRGFEITWSTSTGDVVETFGNMTDFCEHEYTDALTEEIMYFTMNVDFNDVEGFAFRDYQQSLYA